MIKERFNVDFEERLSSLHDLISEFRNRPSSQKYRNLTGLVEELLEKYAKGENFNAAAFGLILMPMEEIYEFGVVQKLKASKQEIDAGDSFFDTEDKVDDVENSDFVDVASNKNISIADQIELESPRPLTKNRRNKARINRRKAENASASSGGVEQSTDRQKHRAQTKKILEQPRAMQSKAVAVSSEIDEERLHEKMGEGQNPFAFGKVLGQYRPSRLPFIPPVNPNIDEKLKAQVKRFEENPTQSLELEIRAAMALGGYIVDMNVEREETDEEFKTEWDNFTGVVVNEVTRLERPALNSINTDDDEKMKERKLYRNEKAMAYLKFRMAKKICQMLKRLENPDAKPQILLAIDNNPSKPDLAPIWRGDVDLNKDAYSILKSMCEENEIEVPAFPESGSLLDIFTDKRIFVTQSEDDYVAQNIYQFFKAA